MTKLRINVGVCGFDVVVKTKEEDYKATTLDIETECPDMQKLAETLEDELIDALQEMECHFKDDIQPDHTFIDTLVYQKSAEHLHCSDCLAPAGILRAIFIETGLTLPDNNGSIEVLEQ